MGKFYEQLFQPLTDLFSKWGLPEVMLPLILGCLIGLPFILKPIIKKEKLTWRHFVVVFGLAFLVFIGVMGSIE
jgi:Kef-type K+ transport system membrane component KefB